MSHILLLQQQQQQQNHLKWRVDEVKEGARKKDNKPRPGGPSRVVKGKPIKAEEGGRKRMCDVAQRRAPLTYPEHLASPAQLIDPKRGSLTACKT